jgi:hypothetical protein
MLAIVISGPKEPGNDIDTFLEPLMEDMQILWEVGFRMWDEARREYFTCRAIIFVIVTDSPALRALSGQVEGKWQCVVCIDGTPYYYLTSSQKTVYLQNRRFLPRKHRYRAMTRQFDGKVEDGRAPRRCTGKVVYEMVKNIQVELGKPARGVQKVKTLTPFKKQSIFYRYLPYWKDLEVTHAIDWMHIGKGVFDNTVGLLLDQPGKAKDRLSACRDLVQMGIRPELHPVLRPNGKFYLPLVAHTLTREEKRAFCKCLHGIKVPTGFSSNVKNLVNMEELKISGYNTHDYHTMLGVFLAIAIRATDSGWLKLAVTRLCYFFSVVWKKVISEEELDHLQTHIKETMCILGWSSLHHILIRWNTS